jgi:hypothetical protein
MELPRYLELRELTNISAIHRHIVNEKYATKTYKSFKEILWAPTPASQRVFLMKTVAPYHSQISSST